MDEISEEMLRLDLKLSQSNNERIRLEQEFQRCKKLTKQAKEKVRQQELERKRQLELLAAEKASSSSSKKKKGSDKSAAKVTVT